MFILKYKVSKRACTPITIICYLNKPYLYYSCIWKLIWSDPGFMKQSLTYVK